MCFKKNVSVSFFFGSSPKIMLRTSLSKQNTCRGFCYYFFSNNIYCSSCKTVKRKLVWHTCIKYESHLLSIAFINQGCQEFHYLNTFNTPFFTPICVQTSSPQAHFPTHRTNGGPFQAEAMGAEGQSQSQRKKGFGHVAAIGHINGMEQMISFKTVPFRIEGRNRRWLFQ